MDTAQTAPQAAGLASRLRSPFVGLFSGLLAALLDAGIARALMAVVAISVSGRSHFSVGGTANIFFIGTIIGPLFGIVYHSLRDRLPGRVWLKGLLFAGVMAIIFQIPVLLAVPDFRAEVMSVGTLGIAVFGLINVSYSLLVAWVNSRVEASWPENGAGREAITVGGAITLGLVALGGLVMLLYEIGGRVIGVVD